MKNRLNLTLTSLILAVLLLVLAITACSAFDFSEQSKSTSFKNNKNDIASPEENEKVPLDYLDTFLIIDALFSNFSIFDIDYETAMLAAIRAYVDATGDKYAMYYTDEEYEVFLDENRGDFYGVGVNVIFNYDDYYMEIVRILPDSPAEEQLVVGDIVTHIFIDNEKIALVDLVEEYKIKAETIYPNFSDEEINSVACYEAFQYAVENLKGPEGTYAKFTIVRNGVSMDLTMQRAKVKSLSVTGKISETNSSVGIVSIEQFDLTTPPQFKECMDQLIASGCTKFVFDVRNNPGGLVNALVPVVSTFLNEGDLIMTTKDSNGTIQELRVGVVNYGTNSDYVSCNVAREDIGKYAEYDYVVLANENSASCAEIFTAVFRDYNIAKIVGMNTYGKGSVQTHVSLSNYGSQYYGVLKLTTKLYFPPCGIGYDGGIGIAPDYEVQLEGIAAETHFYKLTEDIDNQLQKAISLLID